MALVFFNPIISIVALAGMLYLYCQWRTLATALALVSGAKSAHAISLRDRIWDARPAVATVTVKPLFVQLWEDIEF